MNERVFVSSTNIDLVAFRAAVAAAIRRLGAIDVCMEHFGARDARPVEECVRVVEEESGVYLAIIAHRYGHVPKGRDRSITELEYNAATHVCLPRLIYLLDEQTPWVPSRIDHGAKAKALGRFKDTLRAQHICGTFSTPDDLAAQVAADLGRFLTSIQARTHYVESLPAIPADRELRLIQQLQTGDPFETRRSVDALSHSTGPWLLDALQRLVITKDAEVAISALQVLRNVSGTRSAAIIADALHSGIFSVRQWAAFVLGEMALFGRASDSLAVVHSLFEPLNEPSEDCRFLQECIHSIGKIGGSTALSALLGVLARPHTPATLIAMALHGPGRFWPQDTLRKRFFAEARRIIATWSTQTCAEVAQASIFQYVDPVLQDEIKGHLPTKPTTPQAERQHLRQSNL